MVLPSREPQKTACPPQALVADDDFAGPLAFCLVLGVLLLFNGKVFFGYIYGVFVVGLLGLWAIFNLMSFKGAPLASLTHYPAPP